MLFDNAVTISNRKDLSDLMEHINLDLSTNFYLRKPRSGWVLAGITNLEIMIFELKNGQSDKISIHLRP